MNEEICPDADVANKVKQVLDDLVEVEGRGKYDEKTCLAILSLWNNFSQTSSDGYLNYNDVFRRLIKLVSRTMLSGLWMRPEIRATSHDRLRENVTTLKAFLEEADLHDEVKQCMTISALLEENPWLKESVQRILNPTNQQQSIESINVLLEEEGWIFLESRLETLCGLKLDYLVEFTEACVLKAKSQVCDRHSENNQYSSYYDLSVQKFHQLLAIFTVALARIPTENQTQTDPFRKLDQYLTSSLISETVTCLLEKRNPIRLQPNWKGWKKSEDIALELIERATEKAIGGETEVSELKILFTCLLRVSWLLKQRKSGIEINELPDISDHPMCASIDELESHLPEKHKALLENFPKNEYVYYYADSIVEFYGFNHFTFSKCMELYLSRLNPEVSKFINIRESTAEKVALSEVSASLAIAFQCLSRYFQGHSQVSFEVLLTTFSLNPSIETLETLREMATDPNGGVNVQTKLARVHNIAIGLPPALYQDLMSVVHGARLNRLTCFRESWEKFEQVCKKHLETGGSDIKTHHDLDLAKPTDFSLYAGMKPAYDENDAGYEAGYLPEFEDLEESDEDSGKKKLKIREPKHRMIEFYRLERKKRLAKEGKNTNGNPIRKKPVSVVKFAKSIRKSVSEDKIKENSAKPLRRKYIRKATSTIRQESKVKVESLILAKIRTRNKALGMERKLRAIAPKPMSESEDSEAESVESEEYIPSSLRKGSTSERRASISSQRSRRESRMKKEIKHNDFCCITIITNQKIRNSQSQSGVWPPSTAARKIDGTYSFPHIPQPFPLDKSLQTSAPYFESSPLYHVLRSMKHLTPDDRLNLTNRFTPVAESILTSQEPETGEYMYINDPVHWAHYIGEQIETLNSKEEEIVRPRRTSSSVNSEEANLILTSTSNPINSEELVSLPNSILNSVKSEEAIPVPITSISVNSEEEAIPVPISTSILVKQEEEETLNPGRTLNPEQGIPRPRRASISVNSEEIEFFSKDDCLPKDEEIKIFSNEEIKAFSRVEENRILSKLEDIHILSKHEETPLLSKSDEILSKEEEIPIFSVEEKVPTISNDEEIPVVSKDEEIISDGGIQILSVGEETFPKNEEIETFSNDEKIQMFANGETQVVPKDEKILSTGEEFQILSKDEEFFSKNEKIPLFSKVEEIQILSKDEEDILSKDEVKNFSKDEGAQIVTKNETISKDDEIQIFSTDEEISTFSKDGEVCSKDENSTSSEEISSSDEEASSNDGKDSSNNEEIFSNDVEGNSNNEISSNDVDEDNSNNEEISSNDEETSSNDEEDLPQGRKMLSKNRKILSKDKQHLSRNRQALSKNRKVLPKDRKILPKDRKVLPKDKKVLPKDKKVLSKGRKALSNDRKVLSKDRKVLSKDRKVLSKGRKVLSKDKKYIPEDEELMSEDEDEEDESSSSSGSKSPDYVPSDCPTSDDDESPTYVPPTKNLPIKKGVAKSKEIPILPSRKRVILLHDVLIPKITPDIFLKNIGAHPVTRFRPILPKKATRCAKLDPIRTRANEIVRQNWKRKTRQSRRTRQKKPETETVDIGKFLSDGEVEDEGLPTVDPLAFDENDLQKVVAPGSGYVVVGVNVKTVEEVDLTISDDDEEPLDANYILPCDIEEDSPVLQPKSNTAAVGRFSPEEAEVILPDKDADIGSVLLSLVDEECKKRLAKMNSSENILPDDFDSQFDSKFTKPFRNGGEKARGRILPLVYSKLREVARKKVEEPNVPVQLTINEPILPTAKEDPKKLNNAPLQDVGNVSSVPPSHSPPPTPQPLPTRTEACVSENSAPSPISPATRGNTSSKELALRLKRKSGDDSLSSRNRKSLVVDIVKKNSTDESISVKPAVITHQLEEIQTPVLSPSSSSVSPRKQQRCVVKPVIKVVTADDPISCDIVNQSNGFILPNNNFDDGGSSKLRSTTGFKRRQQVRSLNLSHSQTNSPEPKRSKSEVKEDSVSENLGHIRTESPELPLPVLERYDEEIPIIFYNDHDLENCEFAPDISVPCYGERNTLLDSKTTH